MWILFLWLARQALCHPQARQAEGPVWFRLCDQSRVLQHHMHLGHQAGRVRLSTQLGLSLSAATGPEAPRRAWTVVGVLWMRASNLGDLEG